MNQVNLDSENNNTKQIIQTNKSRMDIVELDARKKFAEAFRRDVQDYRKIEYKPKVLDPVSDHIPTYKDWLVAELGREWIKLPPEKARFKWETEEGGCGSSTCGI